MQYGEGGRLLKTAVVPFGEYRKRNKGIDDISGKCCAGNCRQSVGLEYSVRNPRSRTGIETGERMASPVSPHRSREGSKH